MDIIKTQKNIFFINYFKRFVKSEYRMVRFFSKSQKGKDENDKEEETRLNLTIGAVKENKDKAKEENFFYKQSLEQLKALKQKFFKNKSASENDASKAKGSDDH